MTENRFELLMRATPQPPWTRFLSAESACVHARLKNEAEVGDVMRSPDNGFYFVPLAKVEGWRNAGCVSLFEVRLERVITVVEPPRAPEPYSLWRYKNGNLYEVMLVTNTANKNENHPPDVVYRTYDLPQHVWSCPLTDWHSRFTPTGLKGER